jgi:hypothetical protein
MPEEHARGLATTVGLPVAAKPFQKHGSLHSSQTRFVDGVADLFCSLEHSDSLAAEFQHFGHKGQRVNLAQLIERAQDFASAAHFDKFSRTEAELVNVAFFAGLHHFTFGVRSNCRT